MKLRAYGSAAGVLAAGIALVWFTSATSSAATISSRLSRVSAPVSAPAGCCSANSGSALSSDGRFVAFSSSASVFVRGDTNGTSDVFVRNLATGAFTRVSVSTAGTGANQASSRPSISADGRFVAFTSSATNLVEGDTNDTDDVFVRDLVAGTTTRASVSSAGVQANAPMLLTPQISADGQFVTFATESSKLVEGDTGGREAVFVRDLKAGSTTRVSVAGDGSPAPMQYDPTDDALTPVVGSRFVAFESFQVSASGAIVIDVYLRDLVAGTTTPVSVHRNPPAALQNSRYPSISADGRFVAFTSEARDLVDGDTNGRDDIFVRDMATRTTTRISTNADGTQGKLGSDTPNISADGRFVAFTSWASNLVESDTNGFSDVFVRDLATGTITRVSTSDSGEQGDWGSDRPSVSADGTRVVFESRASNLVPGDALSTLDVFVRDNR